MTDAEYLQAQNALSIMATIAQAHNWQEFIQAADRAEAFAPFFGASPELYQRALPNLQKVRRLAGLAEKFAAEQRS